RARAQAAARGARGLPAPERHALVQRLVVVARADLVVHPDEAAGLRELAAAMGLAPEFVDKILKFFE
ncbi:MAG: TerB family tellurite resistance protein, partial [Elusimicrobiota bacterium]|nr:TerB family tellurite resistance protein [Elusimicrobiota bacterium]